MARIRRGRRWVWRALLALLAITIVLGLTVRFYGLKLQPPHVTVGPSGALDDAKRAALEAALKEDRPLDRDEAVRFALDFTAASLSFALDHPTSFTFGAAPRRANCVEYSYLFAAAFDAAARVAGSTARAYRIRSDVRVFGKRVPLRGFADHDWVLIVDPVDGARIFVDPTFYDAWLGEGIGRNVIGGEAIAIAK